MRDSIVATILKSFGAVIGACILGWILRFLFLLAFVWIMDFNLFSFHIFGITIILTIALVLIGITVYLSNLLNNRIATGTFCIITTIWLIMTIIEFWLFINHFGPQDSDLYKASIITLIMAGDIVGLFIHSFTQEKLVE